MSSKTKSVDHAADAHPKRTLKLVTLQRIEKGLARFCSEDSSPPVHLSASRPKSKAASGPKSARTIRVEPV